MTNTLAAIVLAGGRSSRMGRDKAAIALDGVPLLTRTCRVARELASDVVVVTSQPKRDRLVPPECRIVREPEAFQGPLAGVLCGAAAIASRWTLVLACDLPNLHAATLQSWVVQLSEVSDDAIAVLPSGVKGWEPLCGFYRDRCWPRLQEYWNAGGRSLQRWLRDREDITEIPNVPPEVVFNCNTPADLERSRPGN
ncbi:MAG: molybdenum cofactor guanylyltransferase [Cyanobacteria bacterium J06639_1]